MNVIEMPKKSNKENSLAELAAEINKHHRMFEESLRTTLEHAIEVGILLIQAKRQLGHGNFTMWRAASCRFEQRMAQYYMQVARGWKELKAQGTSHLTLTEAIKLLQQSNKSNKNHNNKDTLRKKLKKELAKLSKSLLTARQSIKRIKEIERKGGKIVWAQNGTTLTRIAKRVEDLVEVLSEYFGKRK